MKSMIKMIKLFVRHFGFDIRHYNHAASKYV